MGVNFLGKKRYVTLEWPPNFGWLNHPMINLYDVSMYKIEIIEICLHLKKLKKIHLFYQPV